MTTSTGRTGIGVALGEDASILCHTYPDRLPIVALNRLDGSAGCYLTVTLDGGIDPARAVQIADDLAAAFGLFAAATREVTEAVAHSTERMYYDRDRTASGAPRCIATYYPTGERCDNAEGHDGQHTGSLGLRWTLPVAVSA